MEPFAPLAGLKVLDLSRLLPGPYLTQLLHDLGADVVKVEEPVAGDPARWVPPEVEGAGHAFSALNRGKRSVALDLKARGAADAVLRIAARADVLVESFRPGVLDRLGLGDAALDRANPRLIRCSLVGYPDGEWRDAPGHDLNYEALAGILAAQAPGQIPLADLAGAMTAAVGILAALHERTRTGHGRRVEVALSDAALAFHGVGLLRAQSSDAPGGGEWDLAGSLPCYRVYACADGRSVALAALEPKFWERFARAVGRPDWTHRHLDPDARPEVAALLASAPSDAWVRSLRAAGVPITPVLTAAEAAHEASLRFGAPVGPATPLTGRGLAGAPPRLGEHTEEVLREAGLTPAEIAALASKAS